MTEQEVKIAKYGSKEQVFKGEAQMTKGKLKKDDLALNAKGKVVSKKAQERGRALIAQLRGIQKKETLKEPELPKEAEVKALRDEKVFVPKRTQRKKKNDKAENSLKDEEKN